MRRIKPELVSAALPAAGVVVDMIRCEKLPKRLDESVRAPIL